MCAASLSPISPVPTWFEILWCRRSSTPTRRTREASALTPRAPTARAADAEGWHPLEAPSRAPCLDGSVRRREGESPDADLAPALGAGHAEPRCQNHAALRRQSRRACAQPAL